MNCSLFIKTLRIIIFTRCVNDICSTLNMYIYFKIVKKKCSKEKESLRFKLKVLIIITNFLQGFANSCEQISI